MKPVMVLDCHAICHASKHAYGSLTYQGKPVGVIYGFLLKVLSLSEQFKTTKFVFAWDSGASFRRNIYPPYKVKDYSESTEDDILLEQMARPQFSELRMEVLPTLGFNNSFIQTGLEADDIMASTVINNKGYDFLIVSDDRDLYQLLDHCSMFKIKTKKLYTKEDLNKEWNCTPEEWKKVREYAGCTGDKVPNVPGVKELTAIKYIRGTLASKKATLIATFDKPFLERNVRLTSLPMAETKPVLIKPFSRLNYQNILNICVRYGFNSFLKNRYYLLWKSFCEVDCG